MVAEVDVGQKGQGRVGVRYGSGEWRAVGKIAETVGCTTAAVCSPGMSVLSGAPKFHRAVTQVSNGTIQALVCNYVHSH